MSLQVCRKKGNTLPLLCPAADLHVVVDAVAALPGAQVPRAGGGDEVVALASLKLYRVGLR